MPTGIKAALGCSPVSLHADQLVGVHSTSYKMGYTQWPHKGYCDSSVRKQM